MNLQKKVLELAGILLWLGALLFASFADLSLSLAIADPLSLFGRLLEIAGEPPAILFASFNLSLMAACFLKKPDAAPRDRILAALSMIGMIGTAYFTIRETFNYIAEWRTDLAGSLITVGTPERIASVLLTALITGGMMLFSLARPYERLRELFGIACRCVGAAASTLIIIWAFKLTWGRVRFRQLDGDLTRFTPWYRPQGFTGFFSFPSGHTANAAVILTITYYFRALRLSECRKTVIRLLLALWIVLLAASRVLVGAHYLSDVLFGAAITLAIVFFWRPKKD